MGGNREKFFNALFLATVVVMLAHVFATAIVPGLLYCYQVVVKNFVRYLLSLIFQEGLLAILMLPFRFMELVIANLPNLALCGELCLFQLHEKFFDHDNFEYVCHRYKKLGDMERAALWAIQTIRSAFRAIFLEKGMSVMPTILHPVCTIIKMAIHIDNELDLHKEAPGGDWHGNVASIVGAIVVVDWGFLVWDGVLGPNPQGVLGGGLGYLVGFFIIAGTLVILAVLGKVVPSIGGGDEALHRHIHWMHCVAGFSIPGAQPLVVLASFVVLVNFLVKYS
jgi:hypothetical protein